MESLANVFVELGTGFATGLVGIATELSKLFFTIGEAGFQIEPLGYISMFGLIFSAVFFVFRWISGLFRVRGSR